MTYVNFPKNMTKKTNQQNWIVENTLDLKTKGY